MPRGTVVVPLPLRLRPRLEWARLVLGADSFESTVRQILDDYRQGEFGPGPPIRMPVELSERGYPLWAVNLTPQTRLDLRIVTKTMGARNYGEALWRILEGWVEWRAGKRWQEERKEMLRQDLRWLERLLEPGAQPLSSR